MIIDFTKAGLKKSLFKAIRVALYIIASMAIIGLGMFVKDQTVSLEAVKLAMLAGGANVLIVFLVKWVGTKAK